MGAAWMPWTGARSVAALPGRAAEAFLRERSSLPSTVRRRATTLRSWLEVFHERG